MWGLGKRGWELWLWSGYINGGYASSCVGKESGQGYIHMWERGIDDKKIQGLVGFIGEEDILAETLLYEEDVTMEENC